MQTSILMDNPIVGIKLSMSYHVVSWTPWGVPGPLQLVCNISRHLPQMRLVSAITTCFRDTPVPVLAPTSPNKLEYLLAVSKNLAHPLHPVYDDGKGGDWKWWECRFVSLNSHISAYARCLARSRKWSSPCKLYCKLPIPRGYSSTRLRPSCTTTTRNYLLPHCVGARRCDTSVC